MRDDDMTGTFANIDYQNLYMATRSADQPWDVDMRRFRRYLYEKYHVINAYLFMGAFEIHRQELYTTFQECGYVLIFREHGADLRGRKKGNVDVDVVFEMMRDSFTNAQMEKALLVSGDGDYYRTVSYLMDMGKFERILLPSRKNASSLYKRLPESKKAFIDDPAMRNKIGRRQ